MCKIKIFGLGGLNENGKNCYVVEVDNDIFVFDAGLKYATGNLLGIDYIIPDFSYLIKNKKRIIAIVSLILILIVIIVVMFLLDKQYKTFGGSISEVFEINTNNKTNNTLSNEEDKQKQEAIKVAKKKFNELGENVEENNLEVLKIQRKGELYYYISSKDNTLEIRIKDNKITRVNSVPVE